MVLLVEEYVRGLDVPMHQPPAMGCVQSTGDLSQDRQRPLRPEPLISLEHRPQVVPLDEPHCQVQLSVVLSRLVNRHDVRMVERGRKSRLLEEARAKPVVLRLLRGNQLERYRPLQRYVPGPVDHAHAAAAEQRLDAVPGEGRARRDVPRSCPRPGHGPAEAACGSRPGRARRVAFRGGRTPSVPAAPQPARRAATEPLLTPPLGEADDQQAGALGQSRHPAPPRAGQERLGDDPGGALNDERRVGQKAARVAAVRPRIGGADQPEREHRRRVRARRPARAPPSRRGPAPNGHQHRPLTKRPPRLDEQRHVARAPPPGRPGRRHRAGTLPRPSGEARRSAWPASRTMSSPRLGDENAAVRARARHRSASFGARRAASPRWRHRARPTGPCWRRSTRGQTPTPQAARARRTSGSRAVQRRGERRADRPLGCRCLARGEGSDPLSRRDSRGLTP